MPWDTVEKAEDRRRDHHFWEFEEEMNLGRDRERLIETGMEDRKRGNASDRGKTLNPEFFSLSGNWGGYWRTKKRSGMDGPLEEIMKRVFFRTAPKEMLLSMNLFSLFRFAQFVYQVGKIFK